MEKSEKAKTQGPKKKFSPVKKNRRDDHKKNVKKISEDKEDSQKDNTIEKVDEIAADNIPSQFNEKEDEYLPDSEPIIDDITKDTQSTVDSETERRGFGSMSQVIKLQVYTQNDPIDRTSNIDSEKDETITQSSTCDSITNDLEALLLSQKTLPDLEVQEKWKSTFQERMDKIFNIKSIDDIFKDFKYLTNPNLCVSMVI